MAVGQYSEESATANSFGFIRILFFWRASLWKKIAVEITVWSLLYLLFSLIHRFALNDAQLNLFEKVCLYCHKYAELLPVSFMLGFYVTLVLSRWGRIWIGTGLIDSVTLTVGTHIKGESEYAINLRRQIVRYMLTFQILIYRLISIGVKKQYPTLQSIVDAGYIEPDELQYYAENKFWMPVKWAMSLMNIARQKGLVTNDFAIQQLFDYTTNYRRIVILLWLTDWVPVPLCYTQVIWLCVRLYFLILVLGRQFIDPDHSTSISPIDIYVPLLALLQFIFYIGWSKVAESLVNPWGEDDDDFDTNFILGRNLKVGMDNVTNPKLKEPSLTLEEHLKMPRPEDIVAARNLVEKPRTRGHGSIFKDDGFTSSATRTKPRTPTVMVKRSEVLKVKPPIESTVAQNTLRRRGNTVGVMDLSRTTEYEIDEQTGLKMPIGDVRLRSGEPPRSFMHQHSCPSNMNTERVDALEARLLSTLLEADETSAERDDDNSPSDTCREVLTIVRSRDDGGPANGCRVRTSSIGHVITPSRENSVSKGSSDRSTERARSSPDSAASADIVIRIDDDSLDSDDAAKQRRLKKQQ